MDAPAILRQLR